MEKPRFTYRKIPDFSAIPDYLHTNDNLIFGSTALRAWKRAHGKRTKPGDIEFATERFIESKAELTAMTATEYGRYHVAKLMEEAKRSRRVNNAVASSPLPLTQGNIALYQLWPDLIPDDIYALILETHRSKFRKKQGAFDSEIPTQFKPEFAERVFGFIEAGVLPIDRVVAKSRIDNMRLVSCDPLFAFNKGEASGYQDKENPNIIGVIDPNDYHDTPVEHTLYHEGTHLLAGRTVVEKTFNPEPCEYNWSWYKEAFLARSGVHFGKDTFRWLNEAITETDGALLLGDQPKTYLDEIRLYDALRNSGRIKIPESLFRMAYYENYDLSLPPGSRMSAWKELWHTIDESFGERGFLKKLDDIVRDDKKYGIADAEDELWNKHMRL